MPGKQYSVATPIELEGGKTIWVTVGRGFEGEGKYAVKVVLSAIPLSLFKGEPIELFLFDQERTPLRKDPQDSPKTHNYPPRDDVAF